MFNEDVSLVSLESENQDLKNKIALVLLQLEKEGITGLEEQVTVLMTNMMNFFAKHIDDIPSFDSLAPEQQVIVLRKFKQVAHSLKKQKIKSVDEMLQIFVFTVLNGLEEKAELTLEEVINKKSKAGFKTLLQKATEHAIYRANNSGNNLIKRKDFIHDAVLFGVQKAMNMAKLNIKFEELNKDALIIVQNAHKNLHSKYQLGKVK